MPTIPHWIQTWAVRDGLGSTNKSSAVPNALKGSTAVRYEFGTGSSQGLVTHIMDGTVSYTGFLVEIFRQLLMLTVRKLDTTGHRLF